MRVDKIFSRLINIGREKSEDNLTIRQIQTLNVLLLTTFFVLIILGMINFSYQLYGVVVSNILIILFIVLPTFYFQSRGWNQFASLFFITAISVALVRVCFMAYSDNRFTETENLFIPISLLPLILLKGQKKFVTYAILIIVLFYMKYQKSIFLSDIPWYEDNAFTLTIVNISVIITIQFFVVSVYRSALDRSILQLKDKETTLFSLIDNVPIFLATLDTKLRYIMVNRSYEKSFYLDRNQIIGRTINEVLPDDFLKDHSTYLQKAISEKTEVDFSEKRILPNQQTIYAYGKYVPILNKNNKVESVTVFVNDVTDLKKVEYDLKEANKSKNQLFSIIAHDLKSPLNLFTGILNLDEKSLSREEFIEFKNSVRKKLENLNATIDNLLQWSRSQLDQSSFSPKKVDLLMTVRSSTELYREMFKLKAVELHIQAENGFYFGYVDEDHVRIISRNIIHNSLKYTEKGRLIISFKRVENGDIELIFNDSGRGISSEKLKEIKKGQITRSESGTMGEMGTGIGMQLIKDLLKVNNCQFDIESQKGEGTSIRILIPGFEKNSQD